ncbi:hypothetical protein WL88_10695 [Burkholderia diffusa]|uniref:DUF4426 domain-containing protein n=1 Tax=Burkholderia diffusa TaxID=488732 RepID=A0AAW3PL16_9BURK|nr:hypothetical protein [Burkholderia diffusa]KWF26708.1 hypothetical protein WL85_02345 [Burkholderia diffusa]KWF31701.1 hypothetical protein WL86_02110 [Burkholderia diffusa]KWF39479.1 hypothetical protein WL87_07235 [Burkholderia diffusa]KWF57303.1 hypothetical protein WL88_10695 [Burkholderia diffusa]
MKALVFMIALLVAAVAGAQRDAGQHLLIGDIDAYYGIVPSAAIGTHPASHVEATMHGGRPGNRYSYHLVVTLLDHATRQRIPDAQVSAAVQEIGLDETRRTLEPMRIDGTISYGAWFDLSGAGPYRVRLDVKRPGRPGTVSGRFEYGPQ